MAQVLFGVTSYQSPALQLSGQRLVNGYMEKQPEGAKSQVPVFGWPGLTALYFLAAMGVRGFWNFNGTLHVVANQILYSVSAGGIVTQIGVGILGTDNVSMSDNGQQLIIVNGPNGWIYGPATPFQQIVNINFYGGNTVIFFDGYFVLNRPGTNEFYLSALYDGTMWSGTDFASAEAQPGFLTAVAQNLQLLFLMCQNHIEMWYDAGAADFPFQRYAGGVIEKGTYAPLTVINQDEALFFLGKDYIFYRLQGNIPVRVSTHAIEAKWQLYGDVSDAFCMTFTYRGHKFIVVTFPSVPATWVFDIASGMWDERESWDGTGADSNLFRWRANCAIEIYNKILIGDFETGQIWFLDPNAYTEGGKTIQLQIVSAPIHHDKVRLFISRFELDVQAGVGLNVGQGSNPQAMLEVSKDGGMTWITLQPWRSLGKIGEYTRRQRWMGLGCAYSWVFRLTISDPVQRCIIAAHADVEEAML